MAKMATGTKVAIGVGVTGVGAFLLWKFWLKDKLGGEDGGKQATQDIGPGPGNATGPTQTWDPSTNWGTPKPEIPGIQKGSGFTQAPASSSFEAAGSGNTYHRAPGGSSKSTTQKTNNWGGGSSQYQKGGATAASSPTGFAAQPAPTTFDAIYQSNATRSDRRGR